MEVEVWTRSTAGGKFSIVDNNDKKMVYQDAVEVKHAGEGTETERPTCVALTKARIAGPKHLKIKADSNAGRFSCHNYLINVKFYEKAA